MLISGRFKHGCMQIGTKHLLVLILALIFELEATVEHTKLLLRLQREILHLEDA